MNNATHVVFAGGGALGHLYSGLAIAKQLEELLPGVQVTFAGVGKAAERHLVRSAGYNYIAVPCQPPPRKPWEAVRFVADNFAGFWASRWMLREQLVSLVVGLGGAATAPMARAAFGRGVPYILLEQNAAPTRTSRWLAGSAEAICVAFEEVQPHLPINAPIVVTGAVARLGFESRHRAHAMRGDSGESARREKRLVVLGGAGGAKSLNEFAPRALKSLGNRVDSWRIVHQTGDGQLQATQQRYQECGIDALAVSYIDELAAVLFESDLVLCRPSGVALAELALAGTPAVVVPYPSAVDESQFTNARVYADSGACVVVDEMAAGGRLDEVLSRELGLLMADGERRAVARRSMLAMAKPEASHVIASLCAEVAAPARRSMVA